MASEMMDGFIAGKMDSNNGNSCCYPMMPMWGMPYGMMGMGGMGGWGMGGMGWGGGAGMLGATSLAATETAALINQQNTADRVAAANAKADAIAGIVTANGTKIETVKDAVTNGFFANQTNICELGNNIAQQFNAQTMQGMNMHNATTALLNDMRAEQAKCCCESKYQAAADKCEILGAISASESRILAQLNADKFDRMQDKLNAANERNAELKSRIDNQNQTAAIVAAVQANGCKPACSPTPCSPYSYGFCNPCVDGIQRAVNDALGTRIGEILFPTTTPAAA